MLRRRRWYDGRRRLAPNSFTDNGQLLLRPQTTSWPIRLPIESDAAYQLPNPHCLRQQRLMDLKVSHKNQDRSATRISLTRLSDCPC